MRTRIIDTSWFAAWVPRWWAGGAGRIGHVLDVALLPAEAAYRGVIATRNAAYDRGWIEPAASPVPVVSIGNLAVGGAGKTPFAAWVARWLRAAGHSPAVLLRGYGRDEILVHRELNPQVPVIVRARRVQGAHEAAERGCDVVVLDDGFQHRQLARDLDILLVAADASNRTRRLIPRGPWRERLGAAARAGLVVVTSKAASADSLRALLRDLRSYVPGEKVLACHIVPSHFESLHDRGTVPLEAVAGRDVLAVAALAEPQPFARNLVAAGALVELASYPDHHEFTAAEAADLARRAAGRLLIVTLKDAVKLRSIWSSDAPAWVMHQRVELEREPVLTHALARIFARSTE